MSILRGLRVLNSVEAGNTDSTQLESLLSGDAGRKAEFSAVLGLKGQARRVASNSSTMDTIAGSAAASAAITANPNGMGEVASSPIGMTSVLSAANGREAFFGAKFFVGKGLDTAIANETGNNDNTLAYQRTIAAVMTNSASTVAGNATVMSAISKSPIARSTIGANEAAKQTFASDPVKVAKLIEGELGGNPDTTTSLDAVLNTSGRLAAILANSFAKGVASAGNAAAAKFLAKIIGLSPADFTSFSTFYGDAGRWSSVVANADAAGVCISSAYIRAQLSSAFNKLTAIIIAMSAASSKPYWNWKKSQSYIDYQTYIYGGNCRGITSWKVGDDYYFGFSFVNTGYSQNLYVWSTKDTSSQPVLASNGSIHGSAAAYPIRQAGTKLFYVYPALGANVYYTAPYDLSSGFTSIVAGLTGITFYDFSFGNSKYIAATSNGLYSSTTAAANSWTSIGSVAGTNFSFVGYALNKFIAVTSANVIWTSTDGTTWTNSNLGFPTSIPSTYGKLVVIGSTVFYVSRTNNVLFKSTNGTTWTNVTFPDGSATLYGMAYDGATAYLVTEKGFYTSSDAVTWTIDSTVTDFSYFQDIEATDKFVMGQASGYVARNIGN